MRKLEETWRRVLAALVAGPRAWMTPEEVSRQLGWEVEETTDVLACLDVAGWAAVWDRPEAGPVVTLSPWAAEHLGLRLIESGPEETPRWCPLGDPDPSPPKARRVCSSVRAAALEFVADRHPEPDEAAEQSERLARLSHRWEPETRKRLQHSRDFPWPCLLLGQGLTPWPGPGETASSGICPSCCGRPLEAHAYCLFCDRWGFDNPGPSGRPPRPMAERTQRDQSRSLAARSRRKARRKARLSQLDRERRNKKTPRK